MTNDKKTMKFIRTKRNKNLEPMPIGNIGVIGYDTEIHEEDAVEFTYKLPLGAIRRLIKSYYEDIKMYDEENVYLATSSSSGLRGKPYCYRMLSEIIEQLNTHGFNGKKIDDEVFDQYFKADYEKLERFNKNHGTDVMETFKKCNDPLCCKSEEGLKEDTDQQTNIFRWLMKDRIDSPIFWLITEEMVQDEAEQEINRRLTEDELFELFESQYFDENHSWNRMVFIREAINKLIKGKEVKQNEKA